MKTTMLKFPKNNAIALKKVKELEEIAGIDFLFYRISKCNSSF